MKVIIERFRTQINCDKQTIGILFIIDSFNRVLYSCSTLELPYFYNQKKISSIPVGKYKVVKRISAKYGNHFHILDVPNRDYILIHQANYVRQLEGCVAVGNMFTDIDKDGLIDVANSVATMVTLNTLLPDNFELEIK